MPTFVYNKKKFIEFIQNQVTDNQVIVFTTELTGNFSHSKKSGIKVTTQYAHDVFKDEGIGHIAFGETHHIGLLIADKKRLSEKAIKVLTEK